MYMKTLRSFGDDEIEVSSGVLTPADFNSTKYPGVCKPANQKALDAIRELQRQMNRLAQVKGFAKVGVDGDVGPKTLTLIGQIDPGMAGKSCIDIAVGADLITPGYKVLADSLGAPTTVAGPVLTSPPTYVNGAGALIQDAHYGGALADTLQSMSPGQKAAGIGILGVAGYLGYMAFTKKRKGK